MHKLLFIFLLHSLLFSQSFQRIDSLVSTMKDADPKDMRQNSAKLTDLFYMADSNQGRKICERILDSLATNEDKTLYIRVFLDYSALFPFEKRIDLLNKGLMMAKEKEDENLVGIAYMMKGYAFNEYSVTDSAMYYSMRAQVIFKENGNFYDLVHVLLVIADLHYYAGQYEKAEKLYKEMIELKGDPKSWNAWQYNVVLNDLGLIRIKQKRYVEAEEYFLKSLAFINSRPYATTDSLRLPYMFRMLMEINILNNDFGQAKSYYKNGIELALNYNLVTEIAGLYIGKGKICFEENKLDSAIFYYHAAEKFNQESPRIERSIDLYAGLTKTYRELNDIPSSFSNLMLLRDSERIADSLFNRAKYMNLYAEYNFANYIEEIEDYKTNQLALIIFLTVILISLMAISVFYFRVNEAYKKLVKKNLELAVHYAKTIKISASETLATAGANLLSSKKEIKLDEATYDNILHGLEEIMVIKKLYLKTDITLDETAKILRTNRGYLSRIINEEYKSNFNMYVNNFRIKEAVSLIAAGEHEVYSIEGLANKVGFSNRISFNKAFRKYTGVAPSFFIKNTQSTNTNQFKHETN